MDLSTFTADNLEQARDKLREMYDLKSSTPLKVINKEEYDAQSGGERENSENHLQEGRLGTETQVTPQIFHKYSIGAARNEYYRVVLQHISGNSMEDYFMVVPDL